MTTDAAPLAGASHGGTECATFTANALNFYADTNTADQNLGYFLNYAGAISGVVTYMNGYTAASTLNHTMFEFTGSNYFVSGQVYNVWHDDGATVTINGKTYLNSSPVPYKDDKFTYTGDTGVFNFDYTYNDWTSSATYRTDAAPATPEPASVVLFGTGCAGLVLAARGRRGTSTAIGVAGAGTSRGKLPNWWGD